MFKILFLTITLTLICSCDSFIPDANKTFGTQHFVSAVSFIELHKTRNGAYPNNLKELEFLGDWDAIWISSVKYEKTFDGYNLYLTRGWIGKTSLEFPEKFKQGLGIKKTNITWSTTAN